MKETNKWLLAVFCCSVLCMALNGCGQSGPEAGSPETDSISNAEVLEEEALRQTGIMPTAAADNQEAEGRLIEDQTFQVMLKPLGEVTFSSYEPDVERDQFGDAVFTLQRDDGTVYTLEGMYEDNSRPNELFHSVEAVSFPDFDHDGNSDIMTICSYLPSSGSDAGERESEARIYRGNDDGTFTLDREITAAANSAVAEKTIPIILDFVGAGRPAADYMEAWQTAYINYLTSHGNDSIAGYVPIYIDDDEIPELVEIGSSEAVGTRILMFSKGDVTEFQISRLNFSYIERGNLICNSDGHMDSYYDLIYRVEDGSITTVAAGYYGAEDSTNLQLDENGLPVYTYTFWSGEGQMPDSLSEALSQGKSLPKEEYIRALNAVFDTSKSSLGYVWGVWSSREEMTREIETIASR